MATGLKRRLETVEKRVGDISSCAVCARYAGDPFIFKHTFMATCLSCGSPLEVADIEYTPEMQAASERIYEGGRTHAEATRALLGNPDLMALAEWVGAEIDARRAVAERRVQ
jgi:hypothetical protein